MDNPVSTPLHELEATFADKKFELPAMGSFPATGHLFDRATVLAVVAACGAERPLLLRGEPGVGKSQLAQAAAFMLGRHLLTSVIQPRTEYQDLLWSFDYTERLGQAQLLSLQKNVADAEGLLDAKKFISPGPVWWALNWKHAQKYANVSGYRPNPTPDNLPPANGVVLLIDEIDKADIDLPNGLLEVLGNGAFNVPWLDEAVKPAAAGQGEDVEAGYPVLPPHAQVLVLSDLGWMAENSAVAREDWRYWGGWLEERGICAQVFSPVWPVPPMAGFKLHAWESVRGQRPVAGVVDALLASLALMWMGDLAMLRAQFCQLPEVLRLRLQVAMRIWRKTKSPAVQVFEQLVAAEHGLEEVPSETIWQELLVKIKSNKSGMMAAESIWLAAIAPAAPFRKHPGHALRMWQAIHAACAQQGQPLPINASYLASYTGQKERWRVWERDDGRLRIEPDDQQDFVAPALMRFNGSLFDQYGRKIDSPRDVGLQDGPMIIESLDGRAVWAVLEKPKWASACGRDQLGGWAEFSVDHVVQRLRFVPAGWFIMGSPNDEKGRFDEEGPLHRVAISQGFWMGDTVCTQALWKKVMGVNPCRSSLTEKGKLTHPVESVSWNVVHLFLQKLGASFASNQVTLPTEAEWEYACRAGSVKAYSFGEVISTEQANYDCRLFYKEPGFHSWKGRTVDVRESPANAWGFYQMHGNVWEWCADAFRTYDDNFVAIDPGLSTALTPIFPIHDEARVLRGGSWRGDAMLARSASRDQLHPDSEATDFGFRFVLRTTK